MYASPPSVSPRGLCCNVRSTLDRVTCIQPRLEGGITSQHVDLGSTHHTECMGRYGIRKPCAESHNSSRQKPRKRAWAKAYEKQIQVEVPNLLHSGDGCALKPVPRATGTCCACGWSRARPPDKGSSSYVPPAHRVSGWDASTPTAAARTQLNINALYLHTALRWRARRRTRLACDNAVPRARLPLWDSTCAVRHIPWHRRNAPAAERPTLLWPQLAPAPVDLVRTDAWMLPA